MITPSCCGPVIENWALNKSFYVCTECKQEVFAMPDTTPEPSVAASVIWTTYPVTPVPMAVEEVRDYPEDYDQLELFEMFVPHGQD